MVSILLAIDQIYPTAVEVVVLLAGIGFAGYLTYTYYRMTSSTSERLFGVLNRHFKSLNRVFLVLGTAQILYFVIRLLASIHPTGGAFFSRMITYFDLLALGLLVAVFFLGQPLLKNLRTLPEVYEVEEF